MQKTEIEWTRTYQPDGSYKPGYTLNPFLARPIGDESVKIGWFCDKPDRESGCKYCYAEVLNKRYGNKLSFDKTSRGKIEFVFREKEQTDLLRLNESAPGTRIFVGDMYDLWQPAISDNLRNMAFDYFEKCADLNLQFLTKYAARMQRFFDERYGNGGLPIHFWVGISAATQSWLQDWLPYLLETKAAIRFLSLEPLLEPIKLKQVHLKTKNTFYDCLTGKIDSESSLYQGDLPTLDWIIVGGESGRKARAVNLDWVRKIRDDCQSSGIAFFFKQHGGFRKKQAGRILDGQEWNQFPDAKF